jgi:cell division protein FtsB
LRRDEFVALNTWQIQKLKPRVTTLEEKVQTLEAENAKLKEQMAQLLSQ